MHAPCDSASEVTNEHLLAVLMAGRCGMPTARRKAARLLSDCGGLPGLARLGPALEHVPGLEPVAARRLSAAIELGRRCAEPAAARPTVIACSDDIVDMIGPRIRRLLHEQVWMVALDARNGVVARCRIAEGGQHGCALLARDVLRVAVQVGAQSFVLVHNHPGGDPRPSAEDVHLTEQVAAAAVCVGVPLIDHVIVTLRDHVSMLKLGLLPDLASDGVGRAAFAARVANPNRRAAPPSRR